MRSLLLALPLLLLTAAAHAQPMAPPDDLAERLDALLARHHEVGMLNGTVLVAQGDDVLYAEGFGEADMTWGVPNTPATRFLLASITKQFTAALTLKLVEEGAFSLDDAVTAVLPDYPAEPGDRITVRMLLNHTSGIPSMTNMDGFMADSVRNAYTVEEMLAVFQDAPLDFEPGAEYRYNNSGYFLLGALIEAVTGMTYAEALEAKLLGPLGLAHTGYADGSIIDSLATGYTRVGLGYDHVDYLDPTVPYAAGMLYSTAPDLHRWNRALYGGAVFEDAATLEAMLTPVGAAADANYGFGIGVGEAELGGRPRTVYRHSGGIFGFATMLGYVPEDAYSVVVLDNTEAAAGAVMEAVVGTLYGEEVEPPKQPIHDVLMATIEGAITRSLGVEAALMQYRRLRASEPDAYDFGEGQLNRLGYHYLQDGLVEIALPLFKLNVEQFPDASNPYDSLGEAYMEAGQDALAIENYRKSIELNPGNENGKRMLERLGVEVEAASVEVPEAVLEDYVGAYELQPGFVIEVTREGARLFTQATGQPKVEVYPSSETEFYLTVTDAQLTFERADDGSVTGLVLHQGGRDMPAPKQE